MESSEQFHAWRELSLRQETPLRQLVIGCVLYGERERERERERELFLGQEMLLCQLVTRFVLYGKSCPLGQEKRCPYFNWSTGVYRGVYRMERTVLEARGHTGIRCVLYFETAVLEARDGPKAAGHHVYIVWRRLSLRPTDALESAAHQVCIIWRELSLRHEMPLSQPSIGFVLYIYI